jgi:hypothetical protein
MSGDSAQHLAVMQARNKAYRWPKGKTGRTDAARLYHEARRIARRAAPATMNELVRLSLEAEDERVRSVCCIAVLDRAGIRPYDADPQAEDALNARRARINPDDYSAEELDLIKSALELIVRRSGRLSLDAAAQ